MTRRRLGFTAGSSRALKRGSVALVVAALVGSCGDGPVDPVSVGGPHGLVVVSGGDQKGLAQEVLPRPVAVRVLDDQGRGVAGARVDFRVVAGGGEALSTIGLTDATGRTSTFWRLGPSEVATQRLEASVQGAPGVFVVVEATAVGPDQADRLVVHGALGPLRGVVLVWDAGLGLEVVQDKLVSDTVVVLQPQDAPGVDVVVFAGVNRPLRAQPSWTPGPDTVHVTLLPPLEVDVHFIVQAGVFAQQTASIVAQLAATERIWTDQSMGLRLGEVTYEDLTGTGLDSRVVSTGLCSGRAPGSVIQVTYVTSIDDGRYDGWGCWSGHVFMSLRSGAFPNLLAHELGHTFTLEHTADGLMYPSNPGNWERDGETFRAHFHRSSALNTIFGSQP